jgi:hypothetical protein
MLSKFVPTWIPKWVLLAGGLALAYASTQFGQDYQPLVSSGHMPGLKVLDTGVPFEVQLGISWAIWGAVAFGIVATAWASLGYVIHFFQGKTNVKPNLFQVFFLLLVLCFCSVGFGAWKHPVSDWGSDPLLWYRSYSVPLGLMVFPVACLIVSLALETLIGLFGPVFHLAFGPDPTHVRLDAMDAKLDAMLASLVVGSHASIEVARTLGITLQKDGSWKHPTTSAQDKMLAANRMLGTPWEGNEWQKPNKTLAEMLAKVIAAIESSDGKIPANIDAHFGGLFTQVKESRAQLTALIEALKVALPGLEIKRVDPVKVAKAA